MKVDGYLKERIDVLHRELEGKLDPVDTAKVRGRVAEARRLLAIGSEKPIIRNTNAAYEA